MSVVFNASTFCRLQDLIQSELAGLAFDSLQQVFRKVDIQNMFEMEPMPLIIHQEVFVVVDPAAGGPSSDYAIVSLCRTRGSVQVRDVRNAFR